MKWFFGFLVLSGVWIMTSEVAHAQALSCRGVFHANWNQLQVFHVESTGERVAYRVRGDSEAPRVVIFLNGIDKNMAQWDPVIERLSKHSEGSREIYVQMDLLGQGRTSELNAEPKREISFERQLVLLRQFIEQRGWQDRDLTLVGHSYGGGIAAAFARENPGWVQRNVLIAPFVDHLETYQPGLGPMLWWGKTISEMWGMKKLYDQSVLAGADLGTAMTWPVYAFWHGSEGRLSDTLALGQGIRNLQMSDAVARAGRTVTSLVTAQFDELIPSPAHDQLWSSVPAASRGHRLRVATTHEAVSADPGRVALAIRESLR